MLGAGGEGDGLNPIHALLRERWRSSPFPLVVTEAGTPDSSVCPAASVYSAARIWAEELRPQPLHFRRPATLDALVELLGHLRVGSSLWADAGGEARRIDPEEIATALSHPRLPEPAIWHSPPRWDTFRTLTMGLLPALGWATELHLPPQEAAS